MAKLVWSTMVSADGFAARDHSKTPWAELDWHRVDLGLAQDVAALLARADHLLMGRVTYEGFSEFWPTAGRRGSSRGEREVARHMNRATKVVFSRSDMELPWGPARLIRRNIANEVRKLKHQARDRLVFLAGPTMGSRLLSLRLIDELWLHVHPIVLGRGQRLFVDLEGDHPLRLLDVVRRGSGVVSLRYAHDDPGRKKQ